MKKTLYFLLFLLVFGVVACGSLYEPEPVGIGRDYSELKKSPCACLELKKAPVLPDWLV
jgi:hypothetical protein